MMRASELYHKPFNDHVFPYIVSCRGSNRLAFAASPRFITPLAPTRGQCDAKSVRGVRQRLVFPLGSLTISITLAGVHRAHIIDLKRE